MSMTLHYAVYLDFRKHIELGFGRAYDITGKLVYDVTDEQLTAIKKILGDAEPELQVTQEQLTKDGQAYLVGSGTKPITASGDTTVTYCTAHN